MSVEQIEALLIYTLLHVVAFLRLTWQPYP